MIRKRDFMLYVLALAFLVLAMSYTALFEKGGFLEQTTSRVFGDVYEEELVSQPDAPQDDRARRIAEYKEKLARGEGRIPNSPPVLTSVDSVAIDTSTSSTTPGDSSSVSGNIRQAQYCGVAISNQIVSHWPASVAAEVTSEGRTYFTQNQTTDAEGAVMLEKSDLITLPVRDIRSTFDTCLPDTTIGMSIHGSLLNNQQASMYATVGSRQLVGYARDGFPIYGPLADDSVLDACGGYYDGYSYEYHIRQGESFILGCYASAPADFNLN